jgi:hypothetical protein
MGINNKTSLEKTGKRPEYKSPAWHRDVKIHKARDKAKRESKPTPKPSTGSGRSSGSSSSKPSSSGSSSSYSVEKIITTKDPKTNKEVEIPIAKTEKGTYIYKMPSGKIVETSDPNSGRIARAYQTGVLGHAPKFATSHGTVKADKYGDYQLKRNIALAKKGKATLYLTKDNQIVQAGGLNPAAAKQRGLSKLDPKNVVFEKGEIYIAQPIKEAEIRKPTHGAFLKLSKKIHDHKTKEKQDRKKQVAEYYSGSLNKSQKTPVIFHKTSPVELDEEEWAAYQSLERDRIKLESKAKKEKIAKRLADLKYLKEYKAAPESVREGMRMRELSTKLATPKFYERKIAYFTGDTQKFDELTIKELRTQQREYEVLKSPSKETFWENPMIKGLTQGIGAPIIYYGAGAAVAGGTKAVLGTKAAQSIIVNHRLAAASVQGVAKGLTYTAFAVPAVDVGMEATYGDKGKATGKAIVYSLELGAFFAGAGAVGTKVKTPSGKSQYKIKGGQSRQQINIAKHTHKANEFMVRQQVIEQYPHIMDAAMSPLNKATQMSISKIKFPTKHPRIHESFVYQKFAGGKYRPDYTTLDAGKALKLKGAHLTGLDKTGNKIIFKKGSRLYYLESSGKPIGANYKTKINFRVTTRVNGKIKVISKGTMATKRMNLIKRSAIEKHTTKGYEYSQFGELVQTTFPKTPVGKPTKIIHSPPSKETMTKEIRKILFKPLDRVSRIAHIHKNVVTAKGKEMISKHEVLDIGKTLKMKNAKIVGLDNTGNKIIFKKGTRLYYLESSAVKGSNIYYKVTTKVQGKIKVIQRGKMPLNNYQTAGRKAMRLQYGPRMLEPKLFPKTPTTPVKHKIVKIEDLLKPAKSIHQPATQQLIKPKTIKPTTKQMPKIATKQTQKLKVPKRVFANPATKHSLKIIAINTANVQRIKGAFSAMNLLQMQPHREKIKRLNLVTDRIKDVKLQGKGQLKEQIRTRKLTPDLIHSRDIIQKYKNMPNDLLKLITKPTDVQTAPMIRTIPKTKKLPQPKRAKRIAPMLPMIPNMFSGGGSAGGINTILKTAEHRMAKIEQLL